MFGVEVWLIKKCRRSMSIGDRVTYLGCCEGTINGFDQDGAPVLFWGWHIGQGTHGSHHAQNAVESFIFRLVITDMYMLCERYITESQPGFSCFCLQILLTVTTLFSTLLYTQTELMNSWQITWWWRSTVVALTCGTAATWQPVWAHCQFQYNPRNHWSCLYISCWWWGWFRNIWAQKPHEEGLMEKLVRMKKIPRKRQKWNILDWQSFLVKHSLKGMTKLKIVLGLLGYTCYMFIYI